MLQIKKSISLGELQQGKLYALVLSPFGESYNHAEMYVGEVNPIKSILLERFHIDEDELEYSNDWIEEIESNSESGEWDSISIFEINQSPF